MYYSLCLTSKLACISRHDLSTLKKRSFMEGVGTHHKFLSPLVFPQLWWERWEPWHVWHSYNVNCISHGGAHSRKEACVYDVKLWSYSMQQSFYVSYRWWLMKEDQVLKSPCPVIQVDITGKHRKRKNWRSCCCFGCTYKWDWCGSIPR